MANINKSVPVWEKYMLTIREASEYFGIGEHKLRDILDNNVEKNCPYGMGIVNLFGVKNWRSF